MHNHKRQVKLEASKRIEETKQQLEIARLNNGGVESITLEANDGRDARGKEIGVDESAALKQLVRMVLLVRGNRETMEPITIESIKMLKKLMGIGSLATKEGRRYWEIREGVRARLERAGIDGESGVVVDERAFEIAVRGLKQEELARIEAKYEGRDRAWREEAIRKSLGRWRPGKEKKSVDVGHYLRNQVLNTRIAREIRAMKEG